MFSVLTAVKVLKYFFVVLVLVTVVLIRLLSQLCDILVSDTVIL